jgi:hypothetical protein
MASPKAVAVRAERACGDIERKLGIALPRVHRDRELLRAIQLEAIASALESADDPRLGAALALLESGRWSKDDMRKALLGVQHAVNER